MREKEARFLSCMYVLSLTLLVLFAVRGIRDSVMVSGAGETGRIYILDAGHGGIDGGSSSAAGTLESELNLEIVRRADAILGLLGERTMLTRDSAEDLASPEAETISQRKVSDLRNRVELVNSRPDGILLSIHQNTYPDVAVHGAQVFYGSAGESRELAEAIQAAIYTSVDQTSRRKAKAVAKNVYLFSHIQRPGVLIECGFLTNAEEESRLKSPDYQKRLALAVAVTAANFQEQNQDV